MGKLVRDRIPEMIRNSGRVASTRILTEDEYLDALLMKLIEEAEEAKKSPPELLLEELADLTEVTYALLEYLSVSLDELEIVRLEKSRNRGGFSKRIWLD
jgi:predicted house-cleaning noncanonical NTP pyrophosphatase (MazG superfamily)